TPGPPRSTGLTRCRYWGACRRARSPAWRPSSSRVLLRGRAHGFAQIAPERLEQHIAQVAPLLERAHLRALPESERQDERRPHRLGAGRSGSWHGRSLYVSVFRIYPRGAIRMAMKRSIALAL